MAEAHAESVIVFQPYGIAQGLNRTGTEELTDSQNGQKQNRQTQQRQHSLGGLLILSQAIMHQETTPFALSQKSLATFRYLLLSL
jgi:hypothetical protein